MNKDVLIANVAANCGLSKKQTTEIVDAFLDNIADALTKGEKVQLVGFGCFEVRKRVARVGRNPQTKKEITIPATNVPVFKAGKVLREKVK